LVGSNQPEPSGAHSKKAGLAQLFSKLNLPKLFARYIARHVVSILGEQLRRENSALYEHLSLLIKNESRDALQTINTEIHRNVANLHESVVTLLSPTNIERILTEGVFNQVNSHFSRNFLPNDSVALQKLLVAIWNLEKDKKLNFQAITHSGFRCFSQNDEDGILLRIFTAIGCTNRYVIEIGSNCSNSIAGFPENLSANLIVNHGWHGAIFEIESSECERMRYFFAREHATRHFHRSDRGSNEYYSPLIINNAVKPENVSQLLFDITKETEPDLFVIDIDGEDYFVVEKLEALKARVIVVEFEKKFRDRYCVAQRNRGDFSQSWPQSGSTSLLAWQSLLSKRGYILCAISSAGFNAFFVRSDAAENKILSLSPSDAFELHPIFSKLDNDFWITPDNTWQTV
jgi:hypothetical protein